jgi:hypothetical protein
MGSWHSLLTPLAAAGETEARHVGGLSSCLKKPDFGPPPTPRFHPTLSENKKYLNKEKKIRDLAHMGTTYPFHLKSKNIETDR